VDSILVGSNQRQ